MGAIIISLICGALAIINVLGPEIESYINGVKVISQCNRNELEKKGKASFQSDWFLVQMDTAWSSQPNLVTLMAFLI